MHHHISLFYHNHYALKEQYKEKAAYHIETAYNISNSADIIISYATIKRENNQTSEAEIALQKGSEKFQSDSLIWSQLGAILHLNGYLNFIKIINKKTLIIKAN